MAPTVCPGSQTARQSGVLFERAQPRPQRRLELLGLMDQQRLGAVRVAYPATELDQLLIGYFPEHPMALWT